MIVSFDDKEFDSFDGCGLKMECLKRLGEIEVKFTSLKLCKVHTLKREFGLLRDLNKNMDDSENL